MACGRRVMLKHMPKHCSSICGEHCSSTMHVTRRNGTNAELLTLGINLMFVNARGGAAR